MGTRKSLFISCLILVLRAILLGIRFSFFHINWILYRLVLLYVGGMIILFLYMCCLSSSAKIESVRGKQLLVSTLRAVVIGSLVIWGPQSNSRSLLDRVQVLFLESTELLLVLLRVYLLAGLLYRIFFMQKFYGPLKAKN